MYDSVKTSLDRIVYVHKSYIWWPEMAWTHLQWENQRILLPPINQFAIINHFRRTISPGEKWQYVHFNQSAQFTTRQFAIFFFTLYIVWCAIMNRSGRLRCNSHYTPIKSWLRWVRFRFSQICQVHQVTCICRLVQLWQLLWWCFIHKHLQYNLLNLGLQFHQWEIFERSLFAGH